MARRAKSLLLLTGTACAAIVVAIVFISIYEAGINGWVSRVALNESRAAYKMYEIETSKAEGSESVAEVLASSAIRRAESAYHIGGHRIIALTDQSALRNMYPKPRWMRRADYERYADSVSYVVLDNGDLVLFRHLPAGIP